MEKLLDYQLKEGVTLKNRFVMAPMTTYSANDDLTLSEEERRYYEARGKEFGMVVTAATAISRDAQAFTNQISIMSEDYLDSMKTLAEAIQSGGAKAVLQLHHGGRMCLPGLFENQDIVSASAVKANRDYAVTPRALATEEVYQVIEDFKKATVLAMTAGFDGIELHGANTYLIQQFFSPHSNRRNDLFGGSLEKRLTFPLMLVDEVCKLREAFGKPNFIIGYRLSPEELEEPGITISDTLVLVNELSKTDIDYIHLSLMSYKQTSIRDKSLTTPLIDLIQDVNTGQKPIIGVSGIDSRADVDEALAMGFDMVAIGMAALADTHVVTHLLNDEPIKKTIDDASLLPSKLKQKLHAWTSIKQRGYEIR